MEKSCCKYTYRDDDEKENLKHRINRIIGSLNGINNMIIEDRYCDDILIQLIAIDKSIKSLANVILKRHLNTCVIDSIKKGDMQVMDEIINLFKRLQ